MAAMGGLLAASRLGGVTKSSGGNDILLNAIAAAVIGGTSLFGGRGSVWSALLGVLVIQSIANGLDLTSQPSSVKFMITDAVLLIAVGLDAIGRRGREAAGRGKVTAIPLRTDPIARRGLSSRRVALGRALRG